ncbi:TIGR00725 family protein [Robertmurraya siralis]|uniref:TIGR00725 family protein n=1 Tax=Robertmurraya siralis TaxID=77777 RepID=UPI000BA5E355|nr:TIGR00725 family protein [Robertmurraya siralis]PAE18287.1 TIGR00725 family protein [Bacillus sp. 7504-2]
MYKIGIIGSSYDILENEEIHGLQEKCYELGIKLAKSNAVIFSGGDNGLCTDVLKGVYDAGGLSIELLPDEYQDPQKNSYSTIQINTGLGYGIRDILLIRSVEGVISIGGGAGTLGELAYAYNSRKPIIAIKNSGGWSDKLNNQYIDNRRKILIDSLDSVDQVIESLLNKIKKKRRFEQISSSFQKWGN